jgi:cytochrome P450
VVDAAIIFGFEVDFEGLFRFVSSYLSLSLSLSLSLVVFAFSVNQRGIAEPGLYFSMKAVLRIQEAIRVDGVALLCGALAGILAKSITALGVGPKLPFLELLPQRSKWSPVGFFAGHLWDDITKRDGPMLGDSYRAWTINKSRPVFIRVGPQPAVATVHPDDIAHVLVGGFDNYKKDSAYKILTRMLGDGLVTQFDDNTHAIHRKELAAAFAPNALKLMSEECIPAHAATMLDTMKKHCEKSMREKKPVAICEPFEHAALRIIAQAAFKVRDPTTLELIEKEFNVAFENTFSVARLNPVLDKVMLRENSRVKRARAQLKRIVESVITKSESGSSDSVSVGKTLLDYMLHSDKLSSDAIFDHSITFLGAGFDTTANALTWFSMWIAQHPQVQEKLYEELSSAIGLDAIPTVDTLKNCTYLYNC